MSLRPSIATALCISYSGYAAGLLSNVIVSRLLGVQGKGAFSLFVETTFALILFASFGIGNGQIYQSSKRPETLRHFLPNAYLSSFILGGGVTACYYLVGGACRFQIVTELGTPLLVMGVLAVPVMTMSTFQRQYLLTIHDYRMAKANGALGVIFPLCLYCLVYLMGGTSVPNFVYAFVAGQSLCLVLFQLYLFRKAPPGQSVSLSFARRAAEFGVLQYLGDLCSYLTRRLDFFLVFWFLGASGLGIYSVAVALAEITSRLSHEVGTILFPYFASGQRGAGSAAAILRITLLTMVVVAAVLFAASAPLVRFLFGSQFAEATACFRVLLLGTIALASVDVTWNHAMASGHPGLGIPIFGAAALADLVLNLLLTPVLGLIGASIAASLSYLLAASLLVWVFCRGEGCSVSEALLIRLADLKLMLRLVRREPQSL